MLILDFEGWFQYRATTDPDPTDEKRGVSGYTFAFAGEPDLDSTVHLQPDEKGVHERNFGPYGGPKVGVTVRRAQKNGAEVPALAGAKMAFVQARILELNGILIRDDFFVIDPLRVTLRSGDELLLDRVDYLNPAHPTAPAEHATGAMLERRQPTKFTANSERVAEATGLPNAANVTLIADRLRRRQSLEILLAETTDPVQCAALESRIGQLAIVEQWWNLSEGTPDNRPIDRRAHQLALEASGWNVDMNGKVFTNELGADERYPWNIAFWMGGFDGDALCAYVKGTWTIPIRGT
jgi:hypothetical protein